MTKITLWDPFRNSIAWPRWFDGFEDTFSPQRGLKIHETDKNIIAEAVVAGIPAKNVEVSIENGVLTIKAEKKEEEKKKGEYKSSSYQYYYTMALSGGQWDKTEAEVEDGVLKVTIPKTVEARPRKITIKAKTKEKIS